MKELYIGNVKLKNKIICAPMAGISDESYRILAHNMGAALTYTEMVSSMGIIYNSKKTVDLMKIDDKYRPISIQIFGNNIDSFVKAAKYIDENIKPDIIDINMGCPVPKVAIKSQAGSALLKNPDYIGKIVSAIVNNVSVPITVKIRSGWDSNSINCIEVAKICEKAGACAITIHPRTRKQGYSGKADWSLIKKVKQSVSIPVIGNGDITTIYDAKKMLDECNCDAIMIGRATIGNPWFINECVEYIENNNIIKKPTEIERVQMIKTHYDLIKENKNEKLAILNIKTHALYYLKYIKGIKPFKNKLVTIKNEKELFEILKEIERYIINK